MSLDMLQNYSVSPKAGKEVMITSTGFGEELVIVLPEVKTCVKYADHKYDNSSGDARNPQAFCLQTSHFLQTEG